MHHDLRVDIDALTLADADDDVDVARVSATVHDALERLAERLARSPFARGGARSLALEQLQLDALTVDDLLAPGGAERLADALYASLSRRNE